MTQSLHIHRINFRAYLKNYSRQNCPITKLAFDNIDFRTHDFTQLFSALKANNTVTEISLTKCTYDPEIFREQIDSIVGLSPDSLKKLILESENLKTQQPNFSNHLPDPKPIIKQLSTNRNSILNKITVDSANFTTLGLELNSTLASWNSKNYNLIDIYKIVAGYYLLLATNCIKQKQPDYAMNYANHGHKFFLLAPIASQSNNDRSIAIRYSMLFGELFAGKEQWDLSYSWFNEADKLEQQLPESQRTDDNWRNLLIIKTSLALAASHLKTNTDTDTNFYNVIMALSAFCNINAKCKADIKHAENVAELISQLGSSATSFIYYAIFNSKESAYDISEKLKEACQELQESKSDTLRNLFIDLIIFVLNEHESSLFSNKTMKTFLQDDDNMRHIKKILIDLTALDASKQRGNNNGELENNAKSGKTSATNYLSIFKLKNTSTVDLKKLDSLSGNKANTHA